MKSKFNVTGLDNYLEILVKADKDINLVARAALSEAGAMLQSEMLSRVPVDEGNLRDHIKIKKPTAEGNFNYVEVGIIHDAGYTDAQTAIYARAVEFGSIRMAARPYIRPAVRAKRAAIQRLIKDRLKTAGLVD